MFDLKVGMCKSCQMVQLIDEVAPELMFNVDYPFRTSTSQRMQRHFRETALKILEGVARSEAPPFIVEFGCNDGTFLEVFSELGVKHLGVDPASNLVAEANDRGICAKPGWFNEETATEILKSEGPASAIFAANTLCHISNLNSVFKGVDILLDRSGCFIFEDPYLGDIVELCSFDQIYDEHIYYFTATSIDSIARRFGLKLIDVEHIGTHGGEFRYTIARAHQTPSVAVFEAMENEQRTGLHTIQRLTEFAENVRQRRNDLPKMLEQLAAAGKTVAGYAATAKSATVLNYCGIDQSLLNVIYDTTPEKHGRLAPGSGIPIEPFPQDLAEYPDTFLLFAWNHAEEIFSRETAFRETGGTWLQFIPYVQLGSV